MDGLRTEYCVEIRVPKTNGKNKFGSGYTLGPYWVLTAYHVLFGNDIDLNCPIEITWWDETAEQIQGGRPVTVNRKNILWRSKRHDIALIDCEPPYLDIPGVWDLLATDRPNGWDICRAAGYLSNLHNVLGRQRRETPEGKFGLCSKGENKIDIDNLSVTLHNDENWAGFSGSPVFSAEGKLVAVIRDVKSGEKGLTASLVSAALDSTGDLRNQGTLRDVLCSVVHKSYPGKQWPPMRIRFPEVDGVALETNLECRWGLWRLPLIGILSEQAGETPQQSGETLRSVLCHVEDVLSNAQGGLNPRLPRRSWHLWNVKTTSKPPRNLEELKEILPDEPADIFTDDIIPGLILVFEAPQITNSWFETSNEKGLEQQVKDWLDSLIKIFRNQKPSIICLVPGMDEYLFVQLANSSDISIEWLHSLYSSGGESNTVLQRFKQAEFAAMNTSPEETLRLFKKILVGEPLSSDLPVPSPDAVFFALKDLDNEFKRKEFWDLLKYSKKIYVKLSERLIIQAASSEDVILADIALRFASCSDHLMDTWLRCRLKSHGNSFLDPWLELSYSEITLSADSSFGGSFVDELAMGLVRLSMKSEIAGELLRTIRRYTNSHLSKIITAVLKEEKNNSDRSVCDFRLFSTIEDAICGCRCNLLEQFPPLYFASLEVSEDDALPFWLILSHRPDESWLRIILKSSPSVRAVFGLLTDQEISSITRSKILLQQILSCRRANRFFPPSNL
ncbi:MAG: hypothetical protein ACI8ZB_001508 [Desulforhopalus sp.]|jgi:hypothetical protein